jgi:hypothetical protein
MREGAKPMRLQAIGLAQTLDGAQRDAVQCVVSPGGSDQVNASTFATTPVESGALPGLRVLSRRRLSIPSSP